MVASTVTLAFGLLMALGLARLGIALRRPLPRRYLALFFLLACLIQLPVFLQGKTALPIDHLNSVGPWRAVAPRAQRNPHLNDIASQFVPWMKAVRIALAEGSFPFRDRWHGCGSPLAANGQSSAFSPWTYISLALPLTHAFTFLLLSRLLLVLTGTFLWLRELKVSEESSVFGAVSFGLSFAITPWLFFPHTAVLVLWPWALFAIELLRDRASSRRAFALLTGVFLLWPLSGHIESAAGGAAFIALFLIARWSLGDLPEAAAVFGRIGLAAGLAVCLTAFSLLPQLLAILASNRLALVGSFFWHDSLSWIPHAPAWMNGIYTTFFPRALGDSITSPAIAGGTASYYEMALGYVGVLGWVCALLVLRPGAARRKTTWALFLPAVCGFGIASGAWPFAEIAAVLPGYRNIFAVRFLVWVAPAAAAVAAFELDRLLADLREERRRALAALGVAGAFLLFAVLTYLYFRPLHTAAGGLASQDHALMATIGFLIGFAALVVATARGVLMPQALVLAVSLVSSVELLWQASRLSFYYPPGELDPPTPLVQFLRARPQPFRIAGEDGTMFPNSSVFVPVEDIRTHDPVERRDYVEFLDATCGYPPADYFKHLRDINAPVLDFLNVRYLLSSPGRTPPAEKWIPVYSGADGTVFENRDVLPRAFAPESLVWISQDGKTWPGVVNASRAFGEAFPAITSQRGWRGRAFVLREGQTRLTELPAAAPVEIRGYRETTNRISFSARAQKAAVVVISVVNDGGWRAQDENGGALETFRANGPFLAVAVPAGEHSIRVSYTPPGLRTGMMLSGVTLVLIALALLVRDRRRRARPPGGS